MTLPTLPTDNLYKFLAIGGLTFILASGWLTSDAQFRRIDLVSKEMQSHLERRDKVIWNLVDHAIQEHGTQEARLKSLEMSDPFLQKQLRQMDEQYNKGINLIHDEVDTLIVMLSWVELVGLVLTPLGFGLWWFKVQRLQDQLLQTECKKEAGHLEPESDPGDSGGNSVARKHARTK
jgi:hypothetical protein